MLWIQSMPRVSYVYFLIPIELVGYAYYCVCVNILGIGYFKVRVVKKDSIPDIIKIELTNIYHLAGVLSLMG